MIGKFKNIVRRGLHYVLHGVPTVNVEAKVVSLTSPQLLQDRVVLITGGSSGIGKEIARACLGCGAKVIITARNDHKLKQTVEELRNVSEEIYSLPLDVSHVDNMLNVIAEAEKMVGCKLTTLVNNAGVALGSFDNLKESEFMSVLETNVKGTVFMSKCFSDYLIQNGIKGNILNVVSSSGLRPALSAYEISKWGLRGFTAGLAKKMIPYGIVVNGIAPGPTATPMLMADGEHNLVHPTNPSGRFTTPEEVANLAVYLISNMARQIVGDIVCMTGGAGITTFDDVKY